MLGKTAGGLYWMYRYLERSENVARLIEAGFRIALARPDIAADEWSSILSAGGGREAFMARNEDIETGAVIDFLLRNSDFQSSVMASVNAARNNARLVRTALTREVWEAVNESWINLREALARPVPNRDLPEVLGLIRRQSALVRGALHGTQLRNDGFNFAQLGIALERADNTARILDMKYYALLRSGSAIAQSASNVQWETILRTASALRAFRWLNGADMTPESIAEFLILDRRMPRAVSFCIETAAENLAHIERAYGQRNASQDMVDAIRNSLRTTTISDIYDRGLSSFTTEFLKDNAALSQQIERDYRFIG
jgi:uncharacterized alpha-E superfamily protein